MAASPFDAWSSYFTRNPVRQRRVEAAVDWSAGCTLPRGTVRAIAHSFQRFALGESGDGEHLLRLARATGDAAYADAVRLLVAEEQRHSALFERGLQHLGVPPLDAHWSDRAFTVLRRSLGLRTEIALFLVAETVALGWFVALAEHGPDEVLRGIGRRIVADEREHVRFQVDRLHLDLAGRRPVVRLAVAVPWTAVALGAATVLAGGHRAAIRACGGSALGTWLRSLADFRAALRLVLTGDPSRVLGPAEPRPDRAHLEAALA